MDVKLLEASRFVSPDALFRSEEGFSEIEGEMHEVEYAITVVLI